MGRGRFITLEGPEGGGKTTQSRVIARLLGDLGRQVTLTREPGGTPVGEAIRKLMFENGAPSISPEAEALLHAAARAQHVRDVIEPALAAGYDVVSDRFADSSLAYQGGGRGLDPVALGHIQAFATGGIQPDVTLLLDLPVEVGLARRLREVDQVNHLDREGEAFHRRVREAYHRMAAAAPSVWVVIDAAPPSPEVSETIRRCLTRRFGDPGS